MGNVSSIFNRLLSKRKRVLILGLDAVGKATILYNLRCDGNKTPSPTVGFGVETENFKNINFTLWDLGGHVMLRPLLRQYFPNTDAIIFVVDCNDRHRVVEARDELHRIMGEAELEGAMLLVLANKQDLPNAMSPADVTDKLGLHSLRQRNWYIQATCATSGDGMYEGLEWLSRQLSAR